MLSPLDQRTRHGIAVMAGKDVNITQSMGGLLTLHRPYAQMPLGPTVTLFLFLHAGQPGLPSVCDSKWGVKGVGIRGDK